MEEWSCCGADASSKTLARRDLSFGGNKSQNRRRGEVKPWESTEQRRSRGGVEEKTREGFSTNVP